ncbi:MAG: DUF748 domain-containing protein [Candidatus Omnitrophica bacterium]|nr:DUF748 domain-containing protein [Candidatus Omnitrophota bacterium]MDD5770666.1 DUF748 domain-containing protein [Candidatus Omnitrophota bacterium]
MKKWPKFIMVLSMILLAVFFAAGVLIRVYAPRVIEKQIRQNLKVRASLGRISLNFPFTIVLEKLEIGDLANIKRISFSPDLIALAFGKVVIHGLTINEPVINLEQGPDGKLNLPFSSTAQGSSAKAPEIYPLGLKVRDAKIIFTDRKINTEGYQLIIDKLNINISKVSFPVTSLATNFNLSCRMMNPEGVVFGNVLFSGRLDYPAGDMDAKLEVKDMDITNFSAYYGNFISHKKLLSAMLNLDSTFKARDNALKISTDFNLSGLEYEQGENAAALDLAKDALDLFTDSQGNLHLTFDIDTRLDNPGLSAEKLKNAILKAAMKNLVSQSPEQLANKVSNMIDKFKDYKKELKDIFGR